MKKQSRENTSLYSKIAAKIEGQIRHGSLTGGDRLPSVRKMSRLADVSVSTVQQAYVDLESRGLIEAKPRSGFFVCPRRAEWRWEEAPALRRLAGSEVAVNGKVRAAILRCFPEGTRVSDPRGGFVLWVEMPERADSIRLHRQALEKKIGILPGPVFSPNGGFQNFIRINCGNVWTPRIETALETLGELCRRQ